MTGKIKNERKKKKQQNILFRILFLLALAVFLYAAVRLILYGITYWKGSHEYKGLQKYVSEQPKDEISTEENGEFTVDFSGLKELNPDCIGWIRFENIDISYPIMQGEDNEYYLKHTFEGQAVTAASIFMDANNHADFSDQNTFIYGHNMKNGSMFGKLKQMYESEKYKDSKYLWICTPNGKYRYEIFSMQYAKVGSDVYTLFSAHDEQFEAYVKKMAKQSKVDMKALGLGKDDYVVTLSTCTYDESVRFVVQARWVGTYK